MALIPGTRLGPYEIVEAIGAGGMGEVYRARDTRLDRSVAIKVLPAAVAQDRDRLMRFEREAKTLAALNHTNIAQIYGLESNALAMEFVEGEDLSARIARGPLPIDDALDVARQIAEALDAAHALGIVHRDLKPSNIRIRDDGTVKVLDFGLAKALSPAVDLAMGTSAPTITSPAMTAMGVVLGTAAYMAPEQAKGRAVDKRGDIWAFGVVLYEMVTGRRPFDGETVSEVVAAVIKSDPDWTPVPPRLRRLLESCLAKEPTRRLRDIGDWTRQLDDGDTVRTSTPSRAWAGWVAAAILLALLSGLGITHFGETAPPPEIVRFQITPPEGHTLGEFVVSPNGRSLAFTTRDEKGISRLWIRDFEALESRPVAGTEGGRGPFWNPDSSVLGFLVDRTLKKVPIAGGPVATICEGSAGNAMGTAAWSRSGVILVGGTTAGSIRQVPETGGTLTSVTALDRDRGEAVHGLAWWLPDERHFLYVRVSLLGQSGIFVGSIDRKPEEQDREPLVADTGRGVFVEMESQRGRILFLRNGTLMAQPIDLSSYALTGQPVPTAERVSNFGSAGLFSASTKALAYRSGGGSGTGVAADLTWLNDHGQTIKVLGPVQSAFSIELAPDEGRAGVTLAPSMNTDVWVAELDPYKLVRLTTSPTDDRSSIWSPDGRRIAFHSNRTGGRTDLYLKNIDTGAEDLLLHTDESKMPTSWSRDGRFLLFQTNQPGNTDLWVLPLDDRTPSVILKTPSGENTGRFSPDGRWIAYQSNVSGNTQVYVRSFDSALPASPGVVSQVSSKGGSNPRWTRDGKSLVFVAPGGMLTLVDVTTVPRLTVSAPRELFRLPGIPTVPGLQNTAAWDVTRDGKRFLVAVPTGEEARAPITVVLNWGATGSK